MKLDAIIVGSGINGLVAAVHLLSKGWKVAVYEAASVPGGAVKSGEYIEPGFLHDWAAMNLSLFAGSEFHQKYGEELAECGLEFASAAHCFASVFPDGTWLGVSNDAAVNAARISKISENDANTWRDLTDGFGKQAEAIFAILGSPMGVGGLGKLFWSLLRKLKPTGLSDLGRFLMTSPRSWLDNTFENEKVKAMLAAGNAFGLFTRYSGWSVISLPGGHGKSSLWYGAWQRGAQCLTKTHLWHLSSARAGKCFVIRRWLKS